MRSVVRRMTFEQATEIGQRASEYARSYVISWRSRLYSVIQDGFRWADRIDKKRLDASRTVE